MDTIDWTSVTDLAAELSTAPAGLQAAVLAQANGILTRDVWGDQITFGRALLAAHIATMMLRKGRSGALSAEAVGPVSRSFLQPQPFSALDSTSYGAEFKRVARTLPAARFSVS